MVGTKYKNDVEKGDRMFPVGMTIWDIGQRRQSEKVTVCKKKKKTKRKWGNEAHIYPGENAKKADGKTK